MLKSSTRGNVALVGDEVAPVVVHPQPRFHFSTAELPRVQAAWRDWPDTPLPFATRRPKHSFEVVDNLQVSARTTTSQEEL